jgi:aspartate-semialdehyde dehydrogenase
MRVLGDDIRVEEARPESFEGIDVCFFAATGRASEDYAPEARRRGVVVIDKSNAFRMNDDVPLVVPEVNASDLRYHRGIIASPNCSTIQLVVALKPLEDAATLRRVIVATYQSVSGTGKEAVEELRRQSREVLDGQVPVLGVYPRQIAFNVIPHIDAFEEDGYTQEEWKMTNETRKILDRPDLEVSATCVRVPVFVGHSEAVLVHTRRPLDPREAEDILRGAPSVEVMTKGDYPLPADVAGSDKVFVGRIRRDLSSHDGLWLWIVADNLRKGAATNAVQIAFSLIDLGLL